MNRSVKRNNILNTLKHINTDGFLKLLPCNKLLRIILHYNFLFLILKAIYFYYLFFMVTKYMNSNSTEIKCLISTFIPKQS